MTAKMRFTHDTVVADAIAVDPGVVDRLAAFHPAFRKLRNPVLRRVMAKLVTFADAAKVAGVDVDAVVGAANGENPGADRGPKPSAAEVRRDASGPPEWVALADDAAVTRLDVRPMFDKGEEPLGTIMRAAATVKDGGILILDAPFEPAPLYRVLGAKGFVSHAEQLAADHWRIFFRREGKPVSAGESGREPEGGVAAVAHVWRAADGVHIDVRGLPPPEPMLAILRLIDSPDTGDIVIVHHEREPVFLYPELAERAWRHAIVPGESGEVRLRLTRAPA